MQQNSHYCSATQPSLVKYCKVLYNHLGLVSMLSLVPTSLWTPYLLKHFTQEVRNDKFVIIFVCMKFGK